MFSKCFYERPVCFRVQVSHAACFYGFGCEGSENQRKKQAIRLVTVWLVKQNKQLLISINKHFPARFAKRYKEGIRLTAGI